MDEWVSDWDCDWERMKGVGTKQGRIDEFMLLLLCSIGWMAMCGAVDRRVNDAVPLRSHISLDGGAFYMHHRTV